MDPKFALWSNFNPPFSCEDDRNRKNCYSAGKHLPLEYPNISKSRLYLISLFREKYYYFLHYLAYFWQEHGWVTSQRVRIKIWHILFHPHDSWSTFQFCGYSLQRIFKSGCASWYHAYIFEKNEWDILMQNLMLYRLAPISNPKMKNQKVRVLFSNCPFSFWDQFN